MDVCYKCGKRIYSPDRCPRCGLTFCEEHIPPEKHECLAVAEAKGQKRSQLVTVLEVVLFLIVAGLVWWVVNRN